MLPDVLHGGVGNIIAGNRDGLRLRQDVCIAGGHFLQSIRPDFDVLEVRLAVRAGGGGHIHWIPLVAGAVESEGES